MKYLCLWSALVSTGLLFLCSVRVNERIWRLAYFFMCISKRAWVCVHVCKVCRSRSVRSSEPRAKPGIARGSACYVGRRASWTPVEYQRRAAATPPSSPPAHSLHSRERERERERQTVGEREKGTVGEREKGGVAGNCQVVSRPTSLCRAQLIRAASMLAAPSLLTGGVCVCVQKSDQETSLNEFKSLRCVWSC